MKNKTALAEVISELDSIIYMRENNPDEMDFEHTLKMLRLSLIEKLPKEKQDLIDFGSMCIDNCIVSGYEILPLTSQEYLFNQNFEL